MDADRERYRKLIQQSNLFHLECNSESSVYQREALRMIEYLYCYLVSINSSKYADMGLEITETARRCIRSFKKERGDFLAYFMAAWKREYRLALGKEIIAQRSGGISFTEEEQRIIRKYERIAAFHGNKIDSEDFVQRVALALNQTPEEIRSIQVMADVRVSSDIVEKDGIEHCLLNGLDSGDRVEKNLLVQEATIEQLHKIENVFNDLQERQKPLLSYIITSKIACELFEKPELRTCVEQMSIFNPEAYYKTVASEFNLTMREISSHFGLKESSVSRSWRVFREKLE